VAGADVSEAVQDAQAGKYSVRRDQIVRDRIECLE
jgi:hypothetical protein